MIYLECDNTSETGVVAVPVHCAKYRGIGQKGGQRVKKAPGCGIVKPLGRFIKQQQCGAAQDRARDGQTPRLTT